MKQIAVLMALAGLGLAGCADERGYGRVGYAYAGGYPGYYESYYGGGYGPYYGGYFGWYGGFYYPGAGIYVYDQYRRPYRWNGGQQRYWQAQLNGYRGQRGGPDWRGFANGHGVNAQSGYGNRGYGGQGYHSGYAPSGGSSRSGGGHSSRR